MSAATAATQNYGNDETADFVTNKKDFDELLSSLQMDVSDKVLNLKYELSIPPFAQGYYTGSGNKE